MHIEVLCEDKSGSVVMDSLINKYLQSREYRHTYEIRPHRGKGKMPDNPNGRPARFASGLMDLLPAKVRAYASIFQPEDLVLVIVMDSDDDPFDKVYVAIERVLQKFGGRLPYVIGISVEEMESWLLGDPQAVICAYPEARMTVMRGYRQDSVCGTWEILAEAIYGNQARQLIRIGYPAVGQYKHEWASKISPCLEPDRNKSPSFRRFYKQLDRIISRQEEQLRYKVHG